MHSTILAAAMVLGAGSGEPYPVESPDAPREFYAEASRPYAPSITIYYPSPSYDCYSHGLRGIGCYPAFCERHYRRPYNYRVKFDYPWHEDVYRNWPDGCVQDTSVQPPVLEASTQYPGPRHGPGVAGRLPTAPSPR